MSFTVFTYYACYLQVHFQLLKGGTLSGLSTVMAGLKSEDSNTMKQMTKSLINEGEQDERNVCAISFR